MIGNRNSVGLFSCTGSIWIGGSAGAAGAVESLAVGLGTVSTLTVGRGFGISGGGIHRVSCSWLVIQPVYPPNHQSANSHKRGKNYQQRFKLRLVQHPVDCSGRPPPLQP